MKLSLFKKNKIKRKEKLMVSENGKTYVYTVSKKEEFNSEAEAKKSLTSKAYKEESRLNSSDDSVKKVKSNKSRSKLIN